jgi:hypothetical protein
MKDHQFLRSYAAVASNKLVGEDLIALGKALGTWIPKKASTMM